MKVHNTSFKWNLKKLPQLKGIQTNYTTHKYSIIAHKFIYGQGFSGLTGFSLVLLEYQTDEIEEIEIC